ncbi:MAG: class I adenylate-forming enzyme family protein [Planctomycetota bacterium]
MDQENLDNLARRSGDVLVFGRGRRATCADVAQRARAFARRCEEQPWKRGAPVSLQCPNGPAYLAAWLALRAVGHPVLLLDASTPGPARARIGSAVGVTGHMHVADGWGDRVELQAFPGARALERVAAIKTTSGSTGDPRGIAVPEEALVADTRALWRTMELREGERIVGALPWSHSYGFSTIVMPALTEGCSIVCPDGEDALQAARRDAATFFPTAPPYLQAILRRDHGDRPASLRRVISAGAPLLPVTACRFRERFGIPVQAFYGSSESGGITFDRRGDAAERGTVGTPIDGVEIDLNGGMRVRSPAVADRYLPDPDPALDKGSFRCSDRAEWRGGELALLGRASDLINVDGRKVSPERVRRVLLELDGVEDAAVFPGRGSKQSVQAMVAVPEADLGYAEIRAWCRRHLAGYEVPRGIEIVAAIPHNARGKPDLEAPRVQSESANP